MIHAIASSLFVFCVLGGIAMCFAAMIFMVCMAIHSTDEAGQYYRASPFNVIFHPHLLDEKGKTYRRRVLLTASWALGFWVLGVIVGVVGVGLGQ